MTLEVIVASPWLQLEPNDQRKSLTFVTKGITVFAIN